MNLLVSEANVLIRKIAKKWGAINADEATVWEGPRWESRFDRFRYAEIRVQINHPTLTLETSCSLNGASGEAGGALMLMEENTRVLRDCLSAFTEMRHFVVWVDRKPCGKCAGTGKQRKSSCKPCGGSGWICEGDNP